MFFSTSSHALLQSSCFNFYGKFRLICYIHITSKPGLNCNEKPTCENCGTQNTGLNFARHRKRLLLEDRFVLSVPFSPQSPELKRIITLPRNTLRQLLGLFKTAKYVTKLFIAFTSWKNKSGRNM